MQLHRLNIEISEELLESLKKASEEQHISEEKLIEQILAKALSPKKESQKPTMPSVALIKNDFIFDSPIESPIKRQDLGFSRPTANLASAEKINRKQELEARMKELSLLIKTAENLNKKEEYIELYAQLAVELNALL